MNSHEETKGVRAVIILDVIGRPPEHLIGSLEKIIDDIDKEKGMNIKSREIKKPTLMKDQEKFYTTFAEIEIEVEDLLQFVILLFKYMPAHVEIISPESIALTNNGWNDILNELTRRLHGYDEIARIAQMEKIVLSKKIEELGGEIPRQLINQPQPPETKDKKQLKKSRAKKKK